MMVALWALVVTLLLVEARFRIQRLERELSKLRRMVLPTQGEVSP